MPIGPGLGRPIGPQEECARWHVRQPTAVVTMGLYYLWRIFSLGRCDKGKPAERRGRKTYGPLSVGEVAGLPNSGGALYNAPPLARGRVGVV
jgi:hypothetical protein